MTKYHLTAMLIAVFCIATTPVHGQGFSTDKALWQADVCGTSIDISYDLLVKEDGTSLDANENFNAPIPNNQPLPWGDISQASNDFDGVVFLTGSGFISSIPLEGAPVSYNINPANGTLNGFCFRYGQNFADVRLYDGATLVDSTTSGLGQPSPDVGSETYICWQNPGGVNITRIEIETPAGQTAAVGNVLAILEGEFRFGTCDDPITSSFDQLGDIVADVEVLAAGLTGDKERRANKALEFLEWMQDDIFWEQPAEERLTEYGGSFFLAAAYSVYYLERVNEPEAEEIVERILDMLEQIVNFEIAYAIENGGDERLIDRAERFADFAIVVDEDVDNDFIASLIHRIAWYNAYFATQ